METKQEREQAFHDLAFAEQTRERVWGFYAITRASGQAFRDRLVTEGLAGSRVLEFGSGANAQAFFLAAHGAQVTGIDISPVAVEQGRRRVTDEHVADRVTFKVMDAEALTFSDGAFDLACGSGVLHHLDLSAAYEGIARVLQPNGAAVFLEPLGHNPLINAYRRRTPALRTVDEHPLVLGDVAQAHAYFGEVQVSYFHLASLAAIPFRNLRSFSSLLDALDGLDRRLFSLVPHVQRYAWMLVMRLARPIKPTASRP